MVREDTRHIPGGGCEPRPIPQDDRSDNLLHEVTVRTERAAGQSSTVVCLQLGTLENARYASSGPKSGTFLVHLISSNRSRYKK